MGTLPLSRSVHAAGSDVIKVGLIGCGGRGSGAAANAMNAGPDVRLVAMSDIFEDRVKSSRDNLKKMKPEQVAVDDEHCFVGFDAYQKVIASGVDVVLIACTSKFHPTYLKAAVDAGKHVFVEKPHAIDPPGIHVVQQACDDAQKKNLCLVSGLCWRYDQGVQETMKRVLDGAIGDLVAIQETYMRSTYRNVERQPGWSELEYQFRNWYHFRWLSGDDGPQSLLHSIDKGAWALREETPVKAFGSGGRSSVFRPRLRRRVRPRGGGLRVRQRRADVRQCPRSGRLLQRSLGHVPGDQGPLRRAEERASKARRSGSTTARSRTCTMPSTWCCSTPSGPASRSTTASAWSAARCCRCWGRWSATPASR